jgi:hypothetical protein
VSTFSERFTLLFLYTCLTFANIEKLREGAVDISIDHIPWLGVEDRVTLRNLSYDNPMFELIDLRILLVSVLRSSWGCFESDRTHIMIIAVIDVSFLFIL